MPLDLAGPGAGGIRRDAADGDEVFRRSLARLYKKGNDPLEVMKWREIYDNLETALDRCEDVANQIESLVLEYS